MKEEAKNYYKQGYSCSESIIKAAIDKGIADANLLSVATVFSGGMSSGRLCGAIAGAQMVLGCNFGKENSKGNPELSRQKAKQFIEEFKKKHKATCCRVLTARFDMSSVERKQNCAILVEECAEILEKLVGEKIHA